MYWGLLFFFFLKRGFTYKRVERIDCKVLRRRKWEWNLKVMWKDETSSEC